jgi:hypothetical protein
MKCQVKDYPKDDPLKMLGAKNLALQDNTSTIKLARNGRRLCGGGFRVVIRIIRTSKVLCNETDRRCVDDVSLQHEGSSGVPSFCSNISTKSSYQIY